MSMSILALERNYIPIDIETRLHACLRRTVSEWPIRKIYLSTIMRRKTIFLKHLNTKNYLRSIVN